MAKKPVAGSPPNPSITLYASSIVARYFAFISSATATREMEVGIPEGFEAAAAAPTAGDDEESEGDDNCGSKK